MPDIRRILAPTDFSKGSGVALRYARDLAHRLGAELHVVHVYQVPVYAMPDGAMVAGPDYVTQVSTAAQQGLEAEMKELAGGPVSVTSHLADGSPHVEISRMAEKLGCDLIVMGTHGRTGLKHLLIGSVAERVVRSSPVPVLTVPEPKSG